MSGTVRGASDGGSKASTGRSAQKERSLSVGVTAEVKSKLSVVDVVGETRHAEEGGHHLQGAVPLPR